VPRKRYAIISLTAQHIMAEREKYGRRELIKRMGTAAGYGLMVGGGGDLLRVVVAEFIKPVATPPR
jgi:hypothetical protein